MTTDPRHATGPGPLLLTGRIVSDGTSTDSAAVLVDGDRIDWVGPESEAPAGVRRAPVPDGAVLVPGLVDLHCHGALGTDFLDADDDGARRAVAWLNARGTTTLMASLAAAPAEDMLKAAARLSGLADEGLVHGIHAEGPHLAPARAGALDASAFRAPDPGFVEELVAAAGGHLRTMTYAPELEGSDLLVQQLASHGVVPSPGHTAADADAARDSLDLAVEQLSSAGFDGYTERPYVTHVFNGMEPFHHRSPGAVGACLEAAARGRAVLEVIADGRHLSPATVRMLFALLGPGALVLVSDGTAAAGMPDGRYRLGPLAIESRAGIPTLPGPGALAGGGSPLADVVRAAAGAGIPLEDAVASATDTPAQVLGLADEVGSLHQGFRADVVVLDAGLRVHSVYRAGRPVPAAG